MPECRQLYDDEIQGYSLSRGHCKGSGGTSTSIRLLPINSVSIGVTLVKKCGGFLCVFRLTDPWN